MFGVWRPRLSPKAKWWILVAVTAALIPSFWKFLLPKMFPVSEEPMKTEDRAMTLSTCVDHLALVLHQKLSQEGGNVFFSPFSVSVAMSMLFRGTMEETAAEMSRVLGYDAANIPTQDVHNSFQELLQTLAEAGDSYTLAVANAVVCQKDFPILPEYKSDLEEIYNALALDADFQRDSRGAVSLINEWVKTQTRSMIPKVFDTLDESTVMVLLNAVYFKGWWVEQFDTERTTLKEFYNKGLEDQSKKVPMMFIKKRFLFTEKPSYKALELPYKGGDVAMLLLLPTANAGLAEMEKDLRPDFVKIVQGELREMKVEVSLPKFHLEYSKDMKTVFQHLGLRSIFKCGANFKGLSSSGGLQVTQIVHKAVLDVNEEGSEASAVTAVVIQKRCLEILPEFNADHPFLLVIYHKKKQTILFMGRVEEL